MEKTKMSIILPVYNSEKTISRTIESIIKQTYKKYELIIINDGSTDNSKSICTEYARKYKQIRYIEIINRGVSNARNFGIKNAKGKYIMFIDSDDEFYENTVEKMIKQIEEKPEMQLFIFGYERIHTNTNNVKLTRTDDMSLTNGKNKNIFIGSLQKNSLFNQIWNKVFIKDILISNNILFDENISIGEDFKFNIQYIGAINNALYVDEILYKYYSDSNGLSLRMNPEKLYTKLSNLEEQRKLYEKMGYNTTYIDNNYVYTCLSGLTTMIDKNNPKKTKEYVKRYINNLEIRNELKRIEKRSRNGMIKMSIKLLLVRRVGILSFSAKVLRILRIIYRKIRLG